MLESSESTPQDKICPKKIVIQLFSQLINSVYVSGDSKEKNESP